MQWLKVENDLRIAVKYHSKERRPSSVFQDLTSDRM